MDFSIKLVFWLLLMDFVAIIIGMFVPVVGNILFDIAGPVIVFSEWGIFLVLGAILMFLTIKKKIEGKLKTFLLLMAISAMGFFVFVLLHNLTSALLSVIFNSEIEEPVFFILATLGCPIGFLIGAIGVLIKTRNRAALD